LVAHEPSNPARLAASKIETTRRLNISVESEELGCSARRAFSHLRQWDSPRTRNRFGHDPCMGGFATLPPIRHRREIRTIGFHHQLIQRDLCRDLTNGRAILEGHNSGERDQVIEGKDFLGLLESTAEAMKNAAQFPCV